MNYKTIPEMFFSVVNSNPDKKILNYKFNDKWIGINGIELKDKVVSLASALYSFDLDSQDKVAILSSTSYQWALCDYSIVCSGMTTVTVYPTLAIDQVEFILVNSEAKLIFVENIEQLNKINKIYSSCDNLKHVIVMDDSISNEHDYVNSLSELIEIGNKYKEKNNISIENKIKSINPDDLVTLIYTSGTTGMPKGVMLSHNNLISNINEVSKLQKNLEKS